MKIRIKTHNYSENKWIAVMEYKGHIYDVWIEYYLSWERNRLGYYIGWIKTGQKWYRAGYSDFKETCKYIFRGLAKFLEAGEAYPNNDIVSEFPLPSELTVESLRNITEDSYFVHIHPEYVETLKIELKNRIK